MGKVFGEREHPLEHTRGVIEAGDVDRANAVTNEPAQHPPADKLAFDTPHAQGNAIPRRTRPRNPAPQPFNPQGSPIPLRARPRNPAPWPGGPQNPGGTPLPEQLTSKPGSVATEPTLAMVASTRDNPGGTLLPEMAGAPVTAAPSPTVAQTARQQRAAARAAAQKGAADGVSKT